jgi:hypothetical protein
MAIHNSRRLSYNTRQSGQGLVEYALVLILVGIVVVAAITLIKRWFFEPTSSSDLDSTQPAEVIGEPALDILDLGDEAELVESETIPLFNCNNRTEYQLAVERSRRIEHLVLINGQFDAGVEEIAVLKLQGQYGIQNGTTEERKYTIHLTAPANSWVEYSIHWRYLWRVGELKMTLSDGSKQTFPYRVRSGMEFSIVNIEQKDCP